MTFERPQAGMLGSLHNFTQALHGKTLWDYPKALAYSNGIQAVGEFASPRLCQLEPSANQLHVDDICHTSTTTSPKYRPVHVTYQAKDIRSDQLAISLVSSPFHFGIIMLYFEKQCGN